MWRPRIHMKNKIEFILPLAFTFFVSLGLSTQSSHANQNPCTQEENYPEITRQELDQAIAAKNVTVVDVNSAESFEKSHITGAVHYGAVQKTFQKSLPTQKDALIVAYCGGPSCGAWKKAAQKACELGYKNVKHFKPGISGWNKS